ncbi:conserved hypothetical protein [Neorickettsia risticii str. Illinois]|uniref:Uncharacterized protein n=1 Tax=Neorickettsia risticii (strain Illinois) TaxID=434131 RepID=C6V464_NEORI|nr:hypothetical protein [Neorickettsia risticii]ACT69175.1 conserved hypothetical protein [Neorickettsia risticii str. Illinois]
MMQGIFFFQIDDAGSLDVVDLTSCECAIPVLEKFHMADLLAHVGGLTLADTPPVQAFESTPPADTTQAVESTPVSESVESVGTAENTGGVVCLFTTEQGASVTKAQLETQNSDADQGGQEVYVKCLRTSA